MITGWFISFRRRVGWVEWQETQLKKLGEANRAEEQTIFFTLLEITKKIVINTMMFFLPHFATRRTEMTQQYFSWHKLIPPKLRCNL